MTRRCGLKELVHPNKELQGVDISEIFNFFSVREGGRGGGPRRRRGGGESVWYFKSQERGRVFREGEEPGGRLR